MDRKFLIKVIVVVLIVVVLIGLLLWYLDRAGYVDFSKGPISGRTGYEDEYDYYNDPCYHEPGTPDPCGGS